MIKVKSPLLFLLFSVIKKGLKCLMYFRFCSSGRVNKGHWWQSSVSPGKGWEKEGHSSLPGGLHWAGSCPVLNESSLYWPPTVLALGDRGNLRISLSSEMLRHPMYRATLGLAHLDLATPKSGPRSCGSCSLGLSFLPSPLASTKHL